MACLERPLLELLTYFGFRQSIREDAPSRHSAKANTPTAGGLIFLLALIPPLLWCLAGRGNFLVFLFVGFVFVSCLAIGFLDDYLKKVRRVNEGLQPRQKLALQILLSLVSALTLFLLDPQRQSLAIFGLSFAGIALLVLFCGWVFCVLAGSMNASNLTDGLDGLASGVLLCSCLGLGFLLLLQGVLLPASPFREDLALFCFSIAGVLLGFLRLNAHPARVFMGDTGSLALGGGIGAIALLANLEWFLLVLMLVPIWETVSVILQVLSSQLSRRYLGVDWRPFLMTPFHHHLELSGWSETKIVWVLASIQGVVILFGGVFVFIFLQAGV